MFARAACVWGTDTILSSPQHACVCVCVQPPRARLWVALVMTLHFAAHGGLTDYAVHAYTSVYMVVVWVLSAAVEHIALGFLAAYVQHGSVVFEQRRKTRE